MPDPNTFSLHLYITGLALFVPEGEHTMHVLLPRSDAPLGDCHEGGGGGSDHRHEAKLYFDGGRIGFDGLRWSPLPEDPPAANIGLPAEVFKVAPKLPPEFIRRQPQTEVAGHIILTRGAPAAPGDTLDLMVDEEETPDLTNSLLWIVKDVTGAELDLVFESIADLSNRPTGVTLYPNDGGIIRIHLMNLPTVEHTPHHPTPTKCPPNAEHHFRMFEVLFPGNKLPCVRCIKDRLHTPADLQYGRPPGPPAQKQEKGKDLGAAKVIYTCMIAQAELE
jgi:hypothetical protein